MRTRREPDQTFGSRWSRSCSRSNSGSAGSEPDFENIIARDIISKNPVHRLLRFIHFRVSCLGTVITARGSCDPSIAALRRASIPGCEIHIVKNDQFTIQQLIPHLPHFAAVIVGPVQVRRKIRRTLESSSISGNCRMNCFLQHSVSVLISRAFASSMEPGRMPVSREAWTHFQDTPHRQRHVQGRWLHRGGSIPFPSCRHF